MSSNTTKQAADQENARKNPLQLQQAWLQAQRGKVIEATLLTGETVTGQLVTSDQYTIGLRENGSITLVFKHGVMVLRHAKGNGDEQ